MGAVAFTVAEIPVVPEGATGSRGAEDMMTGRTPGRFGPVEGREIPVLQSPHRTSDVHTHVVTPWTSTGWNYFRKSLNSGFTLTESRLYSR